MSTDQPHADTDLSRRNLLHLALACSGVLIAGAVPIAAMAGSKIAGKSVKYQDVPKGKSRCDNCRQWQAPASCKLVDGVISPSGWCMIYAPK